MGTKEKILELLLNNKGKYLSGEEIAQNLGVSRTAVWKGIKALESGGHEILAVTNKGYTLAEMSDSISAQGIQRYLDDRLPKIKIETFDSIDSTNDYLKVKAQEGEKEGYLAVSKSQDKGKGRKGRSFYSPKNTGVYFSLLLRPRDYLLNKTGQITTIAAVAVALALEEISGKKTDIKWVNDILIDNKKVCGILTEASFDMESGEIDYAVLGIGINVYSPKEGYPPEIEKIATSVFDNPHFEGKNKIVAAVINNFYKFYLDKEDRYKSIYKDKCLCLGKEVKVIFSNETKVAKALDLDEECHLIVEYKDGTKETLSSGEISIRM